MITIRVGLDDLASVRFGTDAVWETTASLNAIVFRRQHALHGRLRKRLPARPRFDLGLLLELTSSSSWIPDTLGPQPALRPGTPPEQFDALRHTDVEIVEGDLEVLRRSAPGSRAAGMSAAQFADSVAAAMTGYWRDVLEPLWERISAVTQADIAHHSRTLTSRGLGAGISAIHDELSFAGGSIRVAMSSQLDVEATGRGVWFVPSVFRWPWIAVDASSKTPVVGYAARGSALVWGTPDNKENGLAALLGRSRAAILESLDIPRTTSSLAGRLGLAAGTVSEHLSVLTASGLLTARRDGRRVLYERTGLGTDLVNRGSSFGSDTSAHDVKGVVSLR